MAGHLAGIAMAEHSRPVNNERKGCDAVARVLETRSGAMRQNPRYPEKDGSGAPVDYVFDLARKTYAFEHTIIEAFERQIHTSVDFGKFVAPIELALDHQMPRPGIARAAKNQRLCTWSKKDWVRSASRLVGHPSTTRVLRMASANLLTVSRPVD